MKNFDNYPPELLLYIKKYSSCRIQRIIRLLNSQLSKYFPYTFFKSWKNFEIYTINEGYLFNEKGEYAIILGIHGDTFSTDSGNPKISAMLLTYLPVILLKFVGDTEIIYDFDNEKISKEGEKIYQDLYTQISIIRGYFWEGNNLHSEKDIKSDVNMEKYKRYPSDLNKEVTEHGSLCRLEFINPVITSYELKFVNPIRKFMVHRNSEDDAYYSEELIYLDEQKWLDLETLKNMK